MKSFDLIVVSHLRWNFVWQRPQQLLSRIAASHRILFIEEPVLAEPGVETPFAILTEVLPNVTTLVPQLTADQIGDTPLWLWPSRDVIKQQVRQALRAAKVTHRALWFYTPTPAFMVDAVQPDMIVYDVMDELSNFKFAPPELKQNEARLLKEAAVVFTGGASLYDAKKHHNPNTHLLASGVDSKHYSAASHPDTTVPDWLERLPTPRAAYIGVVDERLDYDIIAHMADACPEVQFAICGPVVKVDPEQLPRRSNIHYPGQQAYADLPRILKGVDVCLMPFARNEATKFISPTKTLEYMAADRPIVSTPITDVERFYSDIVFLADSPADFAAKIRAALAEHPDSRSRKRRREEKILTEQSWDAIAENMTALMRLEWDRTPAGRAQAQAERAASLPATTGADLREKRPSQQATSASASMGLSIDGQGGN